MCHCHCSLRVAGKIGRKLATVHAPGLTATKVKGYGEYKNFFSSDLTSVHTKIEIFAEETNVEAITNAIVEVAHWTCQEPELWQSSRRRRSSTFTLPPVVLTGDMQDSGNPVCRLSNDGEMGNLYFWPAAWQTLMSAVVATALDGQQGRQDAS
ncbi:P-II family nitrogen regulator [Cupriavidus basilensis]